MPNKMKLKEPLIVPRWTGNHLYHEIMHLVEESQFYESLGSELCTLAKRVEQDTFLDKYKARAVKKARQLAEERDASLALLDIYERDNDLGLLVSLYRHIEGPGGCEE